MIAAMKEVGWEGNGGFLTAAPVHVPEGGVLEPLPTRDAMLPILAALCVSLGRGKTLGGLLDSLPRRFGKAALVRDFSMDAGKEIVTWLSPADPSILEARFAPGGVSVRTRAGDERGLAGGDPLAEELAGIRSRLHRYFTPADGFAEVSWINWQDGVRVGFGTNEVAHVRPSGNAPEMRFYAMADTRGPGNLHSQERGGRGRPPRPPETGLHRARRHRRVPRLPAGAHAPPRSPAL